MKIVTCKVPAFPTFIKGGRATFTKGKKHFQRTFHIFDMIYVKKGTIFMTEDNVNYSLSDGEYIILVPGLNHYGHKGCEEDTEFMWVHFNTDHSQTLQHTKIAWSDVFVQESTFTEPSSFNLHLPRTGKIEQKVQFENLFQQLIDLGQTSNPVLLLQQQSIFEQILIFVQREALHIPTNAEQLTSKVVNYIQTHYQEEIKIANLAQQLHFHPDYLTRVMQQTIGKSPIDYLNQYRIIKAKQRLANSNEKIVAIAKEVGIADQAYFSRLFKKYEGITPQQYRRLIHREE